MMTKCVSPWYNSIGWLGIKHQVTYLLTLCQSKQTKTKKKMFSEGRFLWEVHGSSADGKLKWPRFIKWSSFLSKPTLNLMTSLSISMTLSVGVSGATLCKHRHSSLWTLQSCLWGKNTASLYTYIRIFNEDMLTVIAFI